MMIRSYSQAKPINKNLSIGFANDNFLLPNQFLLKTRTPSSAQNASLNFKNFKNNPHPSLNASSLFEQSSKSDSRLPLRRIAALAPEGVLAKIVVHDFFTPEPNITALKSTSSSATKSEGFTQSITLGASYGPSPAQQAAESLMAQISVRSSKSDASSATYDNTTLSAQNGALIINSGNDATIKGVNLLAENLTLNTQNNLSIESLQNSSNSKSKSKSIGAGGGSSLSLNYDSSRSSFDRAWVDDQTTLIGTNLVNINTGGNTHNKGAVIANITNAALLQNNGESIVNNLDAIDGGNLTLNTKTLTFENIYDSEKQKSSSIGLGITINTDKTPPSGKNNSFPKGALRIAASSEGYTKEQTTKTTIGEGTINIGGTQSFDNTTGNFIASTGTNINDLINDSNNPNQLTLAGLNRDITKSQEITKDTITGALNFSTTIDLRLLDVTGKGQKEIFEEVKNLPNNLPLIPLGLGIDLYDVATSITNQDQDKNSNNIGFSKTLDNKLAIRSDALYKPKELTKSANDDKAKYYADKENPYAAFYNPDTGESYFNLVNINGNDDLIEKAIHEGLHPNEKFAGLTKDQEERMVGAETSKVVNTLNFYYNMGNREGNILSQYTSWALSNANYGGVYNDNKNYLNNFYDNSTANVTSLSLIGNGFAANTVDRGKIEPYKIKTAEVEKGDTLKSISKEINYFFGTNLDSESLSKINNINDPSNIKPGDKVKVGTINPETGATWQMFYDNPGRVNLTFWNNLEEPQQAIVHYGRRIFESDNLPTNNNALQKEIELNLWDNKGKSIAHNIGTSGNVDYRGLGSRSNQQIIFDRSRNLVTTPENAGSYDYIKPSASDLWQGHNVVDANTWIKLGNTPQDTTTRLQRLEAIKNSPISHTGYRLYGDQ